MLELTCDADVVREFKVLGVDLDGQNELVERLKNWCILFDRTAESMAACWIAFSTRHKLAKQPSMQLLDRFHRDQLEKAKDGLNAGDGPKSHNSNHDEVNEMDLLMDSYKLKDSTPNDPNKEIQPTDGDAQDAAASENPPLDSEPMDLAGEDEALLDDDLFDTSQLDKSLPPEDGNILESFGANPPPEKGQIEPKLSLTIESLNRVCGKDLYHLNWKEAIAPLSHVENGIREKLGGITFSTITHPSSDEKSYLGRIVADEFGKLDPTQLYFSEINAIRIPLNVKDLQSYSFFPNQVVALRGKIEKADHTTTSYRDSDDNLDESVLSVTSVVPLEETILPFSKIDLTKFTRPLNIVAVAGPYYQVHEGMDADIALASFDQFLIEVTSRQPDMLILLGPFCEQTLDISIEEMHNSVCIYKAFTDRIVEFVSRFSAVKVLLIPSHDEFGHVHTLPTPAFDSEQTPSAKNVILVTNPGLIDIDGLLIAVESTDVLFHLSRSEVACGGSDRLRRLCSHILEQRTLYPILPGPPRVNMDYNQYDQLLLAGHTPHLMILPSQLRRFIKNIHGCVVLNPEKFARRASYAWLSIDLSTTTSENASVAAVMENVSIADKICAQVLKL